VDATHPLCSSRRAKVGSLRSARHVSSASFHFVGVRGNDRFLGSDEKPGNLLGGSASLSFSLHNLGFERGGKKAFLKNNGIRGYGQLKRFVIFAGSAYALIHRVKRLHKTPQLNTDEKKTFNMKMSRVRVSIMVLWLRLSMGFGNGCPQRDASSYLRVQLRSFLLWQSG